MIFINEVALVASLKNAMRETRSVLATANVSRLHVDIEIRGAVDTGSLLVEFVVRDGAFSDRVTAPSLGEAVAEFLRRRGWTKSQAPLMIENHSDADAMPPPPQFDTPIGTLPPPAGEDD